MLDIVESATFSRWVEGLRDRRAVARIQAPLRNVAMGNFGDTRPVGDGVSEMRIHYGPSCRLYFMRQGADGSLIRSASNDIARAQDFSALPVNLTMQWHAPGRSGLGGGNLTGRLDGMAFTFIRLDADNETVQLDAAGVVLVAYLAILP